MNTIWPDTWERRQTTIVAAFEQLVERVRLRVPELVARNGTSANAVKPIHIVRSFALPSKHDDAVVLSAMFTFFGGTLMVHCDLMKEDGPILRDMGSVDLGTPPNDDEIDAVVADVVAFAGTSEDEIVANLEAQRE
ncbi:MAG: hypothetical protein ACREN2_01485 [Candidatus Dormibacteria bacterium]